LKEGGLNEGEFFLLLTLAKEEKVVVTHAVNRDKSMILPLFSAVE